MDFIKASPIIPVLTASSIEQGIREARALAQCGYKSVEVTLRNAHALDLVRSLSQQDLGLGIGVGTVLQEKQLEQALSAGASFAVSPGFKDSLVLEAQKLGLNYLPGVMTPTEMMLALDYGCHILKLFPAEACGGIKLLKSLKSPFPSLRFVPTGGIHGGNVRDYLALENVVSVGGSWLFHESDPAKKEILVDAFRSKGNP